MFLHYTLQSLMYIPSIGDMHFTLRGMDRIPDEITMSFHRMMEHVAGTAW